MPLQNRIARHQRLKAEQLWQNFSFSIQSCNLKLINSSLFFWNKALQHLILFKLTQLNIQIWVPWLEIKILTKWDILEEHFQHNAESGWEFNFPLLGSKKNTWGLIPHFLSAIFLTRNRKWEVHAETFEQIIRALPQPHRVKGLLFQPASVLRIFNKLCFANLYF